MANYTNIIAEINAAITANDNNEITGPVLNAVLRDIVASLGTGYQFMGVAQPSTNPGAPDQRVCYFAGPGTYQYFGGTVVPSGSIGVFAYNTVWSYTIIAVSTLVDNLTTADATKALSANQGVVLDGKIKEANTNIGIDLFELCKLSEGWQVSGAGLLMSPTETLSGYYDVNTRQWVSYPGFHLQKFSLQAGKYYKIITRVQGGGAAASLVLFRNGVPVHIARYADYATFYIQTKEFDGIGLSSTASSVTKYDGAAFTNPNGSIQTPAIADGAVTSPKIGDAAVSTAKLQDNAITMEKIAFKTIVYGVNRADPAACSRGYININTGAFVSETSRMATDFIPVSTNGLYCNRPNGYGNVGGGAVYDENKQYIRGIAGDSNIYTYQDGDAYVRFTVAVDSVTPNPSLCVNEGTTAVSYVPYTPPKKVINKENIPEIDSENIEDGSITSPKLAPGISFPATLPSISLCGKPAVKATAASIAAGGTLQISDFPQYLKANGVVSFYAKITTFNELFVGFGTGVAPNIQVRIDATNVQIVKSGTQTWTSFQWAHGLQISEFINVTFNNDWLNPKIVVATLSGIFVKQMSQFPSLEMYGYPAAVMGSGTSVTSAELRATADKFNKPIWVVGDSFTSLYTERWPYQIIKTIGIEKFLLIGVAGGGSAALFADLQKALAFGTPKFLLWCLGMNDTYPTWSPVVEQVKALCSANGIELILQTIPIPNVSTSDNQVQINAAVKSSGYRFVDACAAMCPNNTWPWYSGFCGDGTHPTELGAKVLASRFLSDFPEFMQ